MCDKCIYLDIYIQHIFVNYHNARAFLQRDKFNLHSKEGRKEIEKEKETLFNIQTYSPIDVPFKANNNNNNRHHYRKHFVSHSNF